MRTYQAMAGRAGFWAWSVMCALLPVSGEVITLPLVISVLLLLLARIGRPLSLGPRWPWPLYAFYALHVIGMMWTTDVAFGLFDLQIKSALIVLPFAAVALLAEQGGRVLRHSMAAFAVGTVVAFGLGLAKALICFGEKGWIECFTQSYLSYDLHPSYAAWYTVWALAYWAHALINGTVEARWRWAVFVLLVLSLAFSVMLASKSGLLGLALVLLVIVVLVLRRSSGRSRLVTLVALSAAIIIPGYLLAPVIASRAGSAVNSVQRLLHGTADVYASDNGNDERLVAWICSAELIRNDAIGAGTGDIKHALVACYTAKGAVHAAERRLNSHSQFLQGGVALGWAGLVAALLVALVPLWTAVRGRDLLHGVFMLLFILNAAIESVLEVQAGVVFFALFLGLLSARERSSPP